MKSLKITSVEGNTQLLDGGAMFGNAPKALWQKWVAPDALNRIPLACRSLLVETDEIKILCEVGIGNFFEPRLADRFGVQNPKEHLLIKNLNQLSVAEEDIDYVILSHLHFDHAGGLMPAYDNPKGPLRFPKAQYVVGLEQWSRATQPHFRDKASYIPELPKKLEDSGRLVLVEQNLLPGLLEDQLSFFYSHGHTPGLMLSLFKGQEKTLVFAADLIPGCSWVHLPITMGYDRYAELVIEEKQKLYETYPDSLYAFFTHDSEYAVAQISKDEKNRYSAINQMKQAKQWEI